MSTTVDSRVVEMRFDNKQFESNVSTTMSTLDKLKQKLNFSGASKGLEDVGTAAKNVNMNGLGDSVQTVAAKFSSLQVMAVTALANITNSAVDAGKRLVKSLSVDQITAGWDKYSQKAANMKTIMNATGKSVDEVSKYLDRLMWFSDETSYSFSDMTSGLATMVSSGGDIDKLIPMIEGVANATAYAGKGAAEFSRVLQYGVNQAYSLGYMQVMDWKTIEGATVNSKALMESLIAAGEAVGTLKKGEVTVKNFRNSLADKWLNTEVMEQGFSKFSEFTAAVEKFINGDVKDFPKEIQELWEANKGNIDTAADAMALLEPYYDELGVKAFESAQQCKTFTEAIEATKDAVSSGWLRTFELIFGNIEQATVLWTRLCNTLWDVFAAGAEVRNYILEISLNFAKPWEAIVEKLGKIQKVVDSVTTSFEGIQKIVDDVWLGKFSTRGGNPDRKALLEELGYNYEFIQELVNLGEKSWEEEGKRYVLSEEEIAAAAKKHGVAIEDAKEAADSLTGSIAGLDDAKLKDLGLTEDEIALYRALEDEADRLGISMDELATKMADTGKTDGRTLLIESFANIGSMLLDIAKTIKTAWQEIFNVPGAEVLAVRLYSIINSFYEFTESLRLTDKETGEFTENGEKLVRIFKGVFAIFDIIAKITGGALKIAFKIVTGVLDKFGLSILDVAAWIGDAIVKFHDWFDSIFNTDAIIGKIVDKLHKFILKVKEFIENVKNSEGFQKFVDYLERTAEAFKEFFGSIGNTKEFKDLMEVFKSSGKAISDWFKGLKDSDNIPRDIILGLINGLKDGIPAIVSAVIDLGLAILRGICECLGIHSPSTEFKEVGKNIVEGLVEGIKASMTWVFELLKGLFNGILNFVKDFDLGTVLSAVMALGIMKTVNNLTGILKPVTKGMGEMFKGIGEAFEGLGKSLKASALKKKATALLLVAVAIGVLAGALFLISKIPYEDLWRSVGALGALVGILAALAAALIGFSVAMDKLNIDKNSSKLWELALVFAAMGASILMFAAACKIIGGMEDGPLNKAGLAITAFVAMMAFLIEFAKVNGNSAGQVAKLLLSFAVSIFILAGVVGIFALMPINWIAKGLAAIAGLTLIMGGLIYITSKYESKGNKVATTLLGAATAMTIMAGILWLLAPMKIKNIVKGELAMLGFVGIIRAMLLVTNLAKDDLTKVSAVILSVGATMLLMALVMKICSKMTVKQILKGEAVIISFAGIIAALIAITKDAGKDLASVALTLIAAAGAIAILAGVAILLGFIPLANLEKGIIAVTLLGGLVAALMQSTRGLDKCQGSIIAMAVIIALLAGAVVGLSFIPAADLESSVTALATVIGMMSLMLLAAGTIKDTKWTSLAAMAGMVVALAGVIWLLSELEVDTSFGTLAGIALVMVAMTGIVALLSLIGDKISKAYAGIFALLLMAVPLLAFTLVLQQLDGVTISTETLISLLAVVTLMTLLLPILAAVGTAGPSAMTGVIALTLLALPMVAFVGILALMQNIQNATTNVTLLITLVGFMALLMLPLILVGALFYPALLGVVALTALALPMLAFVGILAIMQNIQNATANVNLLINMMGALTAMLVVLAPIAPLAILAATALTIMIGLVTTLGLLAVAIGTLVKTVPGFQTFLDTGLPILIQLAGGLGQMIGAFIANLAGEIMVILPQLGLMLAQFMTNAMPFIEGAKMVDGAVLAGVGILAAAIIALTAAELLAGIASFLSGGLSLPELGMQLSQFMINALPFVATAMMIKPEMLEGVKALTSAILMLTGANLLESITSWLTGESSLETFAAQFPILGQGLRGFLDAVGVLSEDEMATINCAAAAIKSLAQASSEIPNTGGLLGQLVGENDLGVFAAQFPVLGSGLRQFLDNVGVFTAEEVATVDCAAQAVKSLATAASEIPNSGGWWGKIAGENDLDTFADMFPVLGTGLRGFLDNVGTFTDEQVATVDCAASAVKALAEAASEIPNSGGWWGKIAGENDLDTFADMFPVLGTGIAGFIANLGTFSDEQVATVDAGANAVATLASVASEIPNSGGWWGKIVGENDLGTFADMFPKVGKGLAGFVSNLGTFGPAQILAFRTGIQALNALTGLANADLKGATKHLSDFGDDLPGFAKDLASFCEKMPSSETTISAVSNLNRILTAVKSIATANTGVLATFAENLLTVGEDAVNKFVSAFTSSSAKTDLKSAATTLAGKAVDGLETQDDEAETAGKNLGAGYVTGINAKQTAAYNAGYALGAAGAQGVNDGQESQSPSKLAAQSGKWLGEGYVIGIGKMGSQVDKAGYALGETATKSLSSSISRISDMVSTDIDAQPTIRPVLDLSDVRSGVSAMSGMLDMDSSVGVLANVGSISSMMNQRTHAGTNADVVSAIDKLNKKMDNFGNTSYTINGVTYDDGSNIAEAMKEIVRVARVGRRR